MASFVERMIGAAKLDVRTYEEVESDPSATGQALSMVVLSSIASGIGAPLGYGGVGIIGGMLAGLLGWLIWASLMFFIGTRILPEPTTRANVPELLRTTGFAAAPGILRVLGLVPGVGVVLLFLISVWMLAAMIIAIRQALDYSSTWRAVGVAVIGWCVYIVVWIVLRGLFNIGRPM